MIKNEEQCMKGKGQGMQMAQRGNWMARLVTGRSGRGGRVNADQMNRFALPGWLATGLLGLALLPGLAQGAAPVFTVGDPGYKGVSNAQDKISANAPPGTGGNLTGMVNQPPAISWTLPANTVVTAPATFALTVNATDPDGTVARVDYYNGATLIGSATAAPYSFSWSNVPAGTYSLTAVATDNLGMASPAASVTVISNAAPSASITAPAANTVVTAPASFTLTANAADSDGTVAKVDYYANGTLVGTATAAPYSFTWSNVAAGTYGITAVATDNNGAATTSAAVAVISNAAPTVSIVSPGNNAVVAAPGSFTLTANATDTDGTIAKVEFYNGTTLVGTATAAPYSYTWNNVPAGSYSLTAVATDNHGAVTTSAAVAVISNQAPSVSLTSPLANAVSVAPGSFTLSANAADSDGTIAKVEYYSGTTLIGTATAAPYSFSWSNVPAGTYSITAVATDNLGAQTTSAAVSVVSDALPTVSLTSPNANAVSVAPGSFTLTANAGSITSTITKVEFYAKDGATNTNTLIGTATAAPYTFSWSNVAAGSYTLTAVATDALGITATSVGIAVTSDQAPTVTLTSPAMGAQITSPNSYLLAATASSVTSTIAKVEFYANDGTTNTNTLIGTATSAPYGFTWTNVPVGNFTLTAVATDALGIATTSSGISVSAIANVPPAVSLTSPANGAAATAPANITLAASATSSTSTVAKVDFYASNGTTNTLVGTATSAPYSVSWASVALGSYSITAVAADTLNATTISSAVNVTVNTGVEQAYYIHTDHLDTPRQITDTAGNVVWQWDNADPFGNNVPNENPSGQGAFEFDMRFPGQVADKETGLFYNSYRDYDPNIGRYIESDPIGLRGGINTYAYALNNPLSYTDPLGLEVTMTCRPLSNRLSRLMGTPKHCSVFVWHWVNDKCGGRKKQIDSQFSLPGLATAPTGDPNNQTYEDDRTAFNNPGGNNSNYEIPPPAGSTQSAFDEAVTNSGNNYSQGTYMPPGYGPNSNTAANNIITNAGGTTPDVPGAWGQHYQPEPTGPGPDISGGWGGY